MRKYKIGIIGYGGFGKFLHLWWSKLENIEVLAIADSAEHPQQVENVTVYHQWEELLADPLIEIVSIVTPPGMHAEMACAAMRAGKHVLLEKPVAITLEEAQLILETQKQTGRIITVDHMIRYNPIIKSLMQLGQDGLMGKLRHVTVNNYAQDQTLPADHWFWKPELSGGILVEHGVHFFDIVNALSGQHYSEIYGTSHSRNAAQRDRVAAMVLYDGGLIASYYHAFSGPGYFEQTTISLAYDLARIEIEGWMPMKGTAKILTSSKNREGLNSIPGFSISKVQSLDQLSTGSRPDGDGNETSPAENPLTYFGGTGYDIEELLTASFEIPKSKDEVYGACVQAILLDIVEKIENPDHKLSITLENAVEALKTAILASQ